MSRAAENKGNKRGELRRILVREALGKQTPKQEVELVSRIMGALEGPFTSPGVARFGDASLGFARDKQDKLGKRARRRGRNLPGGSVLEDGRKCKQRGWLGGELCFQHDPAAAELRKLAGRPRKGVTKGQEVEELLDEAAEELREGRMKPGQAYALGYLAQMMLAARDSRKRETKLDVKWFWEMVDLLGAFDYAEKKLKEQKQRAREAKKKRRAREKQENRKPQMPPSDPLRAGTDEPRLEGSDEAETDSQEDEATGEEETLNYIPDDENEAPEP